MLEREPIPSTGNPNTFFIPIDGKLVECIEDADGTPRRYTDADRIRDGYMTDVVTPSALSSELPPPPPPPPLVGYEQKRGEVPTPPSLPIVPNPTTVGGATSREVPNTPNNAGVKVERSSLHRTRNALASTALVGLVGVGTFFGVGYAVERDWTYDITNGQKEVTFSEHFFDTISRE